ncbi:hypothetical protein G6F65_022632 [Rhizopus arrhizus]|nr:hypothetical protein G6F65_022632 [Rhizopus arrhizus]
MALYEREKSGRGQAIEVPMFETLPGVVARTQALPHAGRLHRAAALYRCAMAALLQPVGTRRSGGRPALSQPANPRPQLRYAVSAPGRPRRAAQHRRLAGAAGRRRHPAFPREHA